MDPADDEAAGGQAEGSTSGDPVTPPFQSRLQAKREERRRQKLLEQHEHATTSTIEIREPEEFPSSTTEPTALKLNKQSRHEDANEENGWSLTNRMDLPMNGDTNRSFQSNAATDEASRHRRQRAEARRAVLAFGGSIWEAVASNELETIEHFFLLEGAPSLLRKRHPSPTQAGRTLLHCAAW
jgi:hypothetical protein